MNAFATILFIALLKVVKYNFNFLLGNDFSSFTRQ